jgi:hypothetical protein
MKTLAVNYELACLSLPASKQAAVVKSVILHSFPSHLEINIQSATQPLQGIREVVSTIFFDDVVILLMAFLLFVYKTR